MKIAYLDYNAGAPARAEAVAAYAENCAEYGNPASVHSAGRAAKARLEQARRIIAAYFNLSPTRFIFTASATEANNTILRGGFDRLIITEAEHDSVYKTAELITAQGGGMLEICPILPDFSVDLQALTKIVNAPFSGKTLISVEAVRHDNGLVQNLQALHQIVGRTENIFIHTDAVQAFGKVLPETYLPYADFITIAGHKIGGLRGCAALITPENYALTPLITGGGQERSRRAGTENSPAIIAFARLIQLIQRPEYQEIETPHIQKLRDLAEQGVQKLCSEALIIGKDAKRVGNIFYAVTPGVVSATQVMIADLEGVCVSAGSACSSGNVKTGRALKAAGFPDDIANCGLRVSFGHASAEEDVTRFLQAYQKILAALR